MKSAVMSSSWYARLRVALGLLGTFLCLLVISVEANDMAQGSIGGGTLFNGYLPFRLDLSNNAQTLCVWIAGVAFGAYLILAVLETHIRKTWDATVACGILLTTVGVIELLFFGDLIDSQITMMNTIVIASVIALALCVGIRLLVVMKRRNVEAVGDQAEAHIRRTTAPPS